MDCMYIYNEEQDSEITEYLAEQEEMQRRSLDHLIGKKLDKADIALIHDSLGIYWEHCKDSLKDCLPLDEEQTTRNEMTRLEKLMQIFTTKEV